MKIPYLSEVKSYLRLLFVGSLLLVALALSRQDGSIPDQPIPVPEGLELTAIQTPGLPSDPVFAALYSTADRNRSGGSLVYTRLRQEDHQARLSANLLRRNRRILEDISPTLVFRTGSLIYCPSRSEIPTA